MDEARYSCESCDETLQVCPIRGEPPPATPPAPPSSPLTPQLNPRRLDPSSLNRSLRSPASKRRVLIVLRSPGDRPPAIIESPPRRAFASLTRADAWVVNHALGGHASVVTRVGGHPHRGQPAPLRPALSPLVCLQHERVSAPTRLQTDLSHSQPPQCRPHARTLSPPSLCARDCVLMFVFSVTVCVCDCVCMCVSVCGCVCERERLCV